MELKVTSFRKEKFLIDNIKDLVKYPFVINEDTMYLVEKGFSIEEIKMYQLTKGNYRNYIPNSVRHLVTLNTNTGYWPLLHDKMIFHEFFKSDLFTPKLYGTIFNGVIRGTLDDFNESTLYIKEGVYVLKPFQGGQGNGIYFVENREGELFFQGEKITKELLKGKIQELDVYGIFEYVSQHEALSNLYPESSNTIRLVSMYDFVKGEPYIAAAILRIGWEKSKPLDNFSKGGLVSMIDLDSGKLSAWKSKYENIEKLDLDRTFHPDTKVQIEGFEVPNWKFIMQEMLCFLSKYPFLNYVGWDIMISNNGFYIIEGNHNPDFDVVQIFEGYMKDDRNCHFFKKLNIYE